MNSAKLRYGLLLAAVIVLCAISLPLVAAHKADKDGDVEVTLNDLPAPVKATLQQVAGTGTIQEIEKEASGIYSAEVLIDGKKHDVEVAADGALIKNEVDEDDESCKNEESEAKAEDDDEVVVAFNDLPAPVAATLVNEAGSGTIGKIEMEDEDGVTQYSADITKDGKKYEVKIAVDGRLIKAEADDDENDDRNHEEEDAD